MTLSVNSNATALNLLQVLNQTNQQLSTADSQVASGLSVSTAADNPAVFNLAQSQRSEISALTSVSDGLTRAQSVADVAVSAGQTISDLLNQMKSTVLAATDPTQTSSSLSLFNSSFQSLISQIQTTISSASFGGSNLLDGSVTGGISFMATANASSFITLSAENMSLGGPIITFPSTASISTQTAASAMLSQVNAAIANVNAAVANIGDQADQIEAHASFVSTLSDTLTAGVGNLVDADVAAESARLTALQVQQQLGTQALSIANQQPSLILTLLRSGG